MVEAILPAVVLDLDRPIYDPRPEAGTRLYNGHRIRTFNLALAALVEGASARGQFPLVIGGDCSVLLGALAGVRRAGPVSLVHLDGHSDFRHPGNYDPAVALGAVAGMDLALATGRGEALMTDWPNVASPLVPEEHVIQIGEREGHSPDFAWPDVEKTAMTRIDVFAARQIGPQAVIDRTNTTLDQEPNCSGLHLSAVGRDLIGLNRLTLAGIIGCVWLTLSDPGRTIGATGLPLSAPAHARWD